MSKRMILVLLITTLLIVGCGGKVESKKPAVINYQVPANCVETKILSALPPDIPDPKWIDIKWKPAVDTDLYNAINSGGIACTYGNQNAEIGTTIIWAPSEITTFEKYAQKWSSAGQTKVDIPDLNETSAYWLGDEATGVDGMPAWMLNFLYNNIWIQINSTFTRSLQDAKPLIDAAIGSLQNG